MLALPFDDYAQSANSLFHFMKEAKFLNNILEKHAIIPRYCIENIEYLDIKTEAITFREIAVLQKCFCDIPFHKLADSFPVNGVGEGFSSLNADNRILLEKSNTHFDYYGKYAIAFSKQWGEKNNLQPILYLNKDSDYANNFINLFKHILKEDDVSEECARDVLDRLAYIKPLRGIMNRSLVQDEKDIVVQIYKNFHDEREWRYVPSPKALADLKMESVIANPKLIKFYKEISDKIEDTKFQNLWLNFSYDDIRYIIVPNAIERINIINTVMGLKDNCFVNQEKIEQQKQVLISKILVLDEIRRDW